MSNAASTVPAKRNVYRAKTTKIPSLDDYKSKKETKSKKKLMTKNADILIVKHKENKNKHASHDGYNHIDDEETWMMKAKDTLESGIDKIDPSAMGNTTQRKGMKQTAGNNRSESNKPSIKIMHIQHYEQSMEERKHILELNEKYEKRIAELEEETARVLGEFAQLYEDNEKLRRKMDTGNDPLLEPYSRVFEDRKILRQAESGYKKRIIRLEQEIIEKQNESNKFQDKVKSLQAKITPTTQAEEKERKTKTLKVQEELRKLKAENEKLKNNIRELETLNNKSEVKRLKAENVTLRDTIKKLELQISSKIDNTVNRTNKPDNTIKGTGTRMDVKKQPKESKPYKIKFDYEYLLPDSQEYD
ncbi:DNA ligase 1-like [Mercenaria mercenaria]|uniref:DNA ligase 1-like n=1 Tax=Mercenaria mercenaria TaxID=6596 RepID=UPI00234F4181|nr:DNA ligase 1-like [Mercenaria mercenaria]